MATLACPLEDAAMLDTLLNPGDCAWPVDWQDSDWAHCFSLAQRHGVLPLLQDSLLQIATATPRPPQIIARIEKDLKDQTVLEILQTTELQRVLGAFYHHNIPVLLFKGGALAHSHYFQARLRPREDTDLLIVEPNREAAITVLQELNYRAQNVTTGHHIMHQCNYEYIDHPSCPHVVDLHWRLSNPAAFSTLLNFEDLWSRSVHIPNLGEGVRCPNPVDALLIACIHRVAHHHNNDRLIWLMDIHLLVEALSVSESVEFVHRAHEIGVAAICTQGLELSRDYFHTGLSPALLEFLSQANSASASEAETHTRKYLNKDRRRWDDFMDDLRALPRWRARMGYLRETVLPDTDYMLKSYSTRHRALLPFLYLHRLLRGFFRLLRSR